MAGWTLSTGKVSNCRYHWIRGVLGKVPWPGKASSPCWQIFPRGTELICTFSSDCSPAGGERVDLQILNGSSTRTGSRQGEEDTGHKSACPGLGGLCPLRSGRLACPLTFTHNFVYGVCPNLEWKKDIWKTYICPQQLSMLSISSSPPFPWTHYSQTLIPDTLSELLLPKSSWPLPCWIQCTPLILSLFDYEEHLIQLIFSPYTFVLWNVDTKRNIRGACTQKKTL